MSALVVDTSSWVFHLSGRKDPRIMEAVAEGRLYLPPIVAAELLSAKMTSAERSALEDLLTDLPLCQADRAHWFRVGGLRAALRAKGVTASTPDAHVAQSALDLGAELLTEDAVFGHIARHATLRLASR